MRISFDIDDTLVIHSDPGETEPCRVPAFLRSYFRERLRGGAPQLFQQLKQDGWEICIYTTSDRSEFYLRSWLRFYGVKVRVVVNQDKHFRDVVPRFPNKSAPSKHPGLFNINLHVDDSQGVAMEGERHFFRTVIVEPNDSNWAEKILCVCREISCIRKRNAAQQTVPPCPIPVLPTGIATTVST